MVLCPGVSAQNRMTAEQATATVGKYCATCHSARLKSGGLTLTPAEAAHPQDAAERWEKVITKLTARAMPPVGAPRPSDTEYNGLREFLAAALDRAAAAKPNVGSLPSLHRLSRTEYQNSIRDLLSVDALPKEMDYSLLLPPDNASSGFDNVADLLFVSPTAMESYLAAAEKISRLAVGDMKAPEMVNIYRVADEMPQTARLDAMPIGTRGGMAFQSYFPLDAEYRFRVAVSGNAPVQQQLEISIDGERAQLATLAAAASGGRGRGGGGRGGPPAGGRGATQPVRPTPNDGDGDPAAQGGGGGRGGRNVDFRIPVKAGPHLVGISFIERNEARDEEVLRPRARSAGPLPGVATATISGPFNATGPGDTPARKRIFTCHPSNASEETSCAQRILSTLALHAYRRPVEPADTEGLMAFYRQGSAEGGFETGVQLAINRLLVSPQFLFRIERDPAGAAPGGVHPVSNLELASRLSFFLWSSIPDDELLDAAAQGKLSQPVILEAQVKRMLADPRASTLTSSFAEQWLYLRDLDAKKPNEVLFPDFDESLRDAFRKETDLLLEYVIRENRPVLELLSANYTFVNERLAKHYGIPNVHGSEFRRVDLPSGSPRGGLLGQGSILTITAYPNRTSPVNRGKWVLENLLSAPPPPPPPSVPALKTEAADTGKPLTMRQAMELHRAAPACAGCHSRMDPIGFAMENFDAIGRWRDRDGDSAIDPSGVFADGSRFSGMAGLKKALLNRPEEFVSTVSERLLMFATGRNVQYFDQPAVRSIVHGAADDNYKFASLIQGVVKSAPFQMRAVPVSKAGAAQ
jgi:hypothetical protein